MFRLVCNLINLHLICTIALTTSAFNFHESKKSMLTKVNISYFHKLLHAQSVPSAEEIRPYMLSGAFQQLCLLKLKPLNFYSDTCLYQSTAHSMASSTKCCRHLRNYRSHTKASNLELDHILVLELLDAPQISAQARKSVSHVRVSCRIIHLLVL